MENYLLETPKEDFDTTLLKDYEQGCFYLLHYGIFMKGIRKQKHINEQALSEYFQSKTIVVSEQPTDPLNEFFQIISGNLDLAHSKAKDLNLLNKVFGWLDCEGSQVRSISLIKEIGGDCNLKDSQIKDLSSLEKIGGFLNCENTGSISLDKLEEVKKGINLEGSKIKELPALKKVEGNIYVSKGKKKYWDDYFRYSSRSDLSKKLVEAVK